MEDTILRVVLPEELKVWLLRKASEEQRSMSAHVRWLLERDRRREEGQRGVESATATSQAIG
jgi:hypothetical protein